MRRNAHKQRTFSHGDISAHSKVFFGTQKRNGGIEEPWHPFSTDDVEQDVPALPPTTTEKAGIEEDAVRVTP
jgi:hypothetical protein